MSTPNQPSIPLKSAQEIAAEWKDYSREDRTKLPIAHLESCISKMADYINAIELFALIDDANS
jgi:hypothetical protein